MKTCLVLEGGGLRENYTAGVLDVRQEEKIKKEIQNAKKEIEYLRASSSMPEVSKIVKIRDKKYLDGGISDSIPIDKAIEFGYDKIIVVLTRCEGYQKRIEKRIH